MQEHLTEYVRNGAALDSCRPAHPGAKEFLDPGTYRQINGESQNIDALIAASKHRSVGNGRISCSIELEPEMLRGGGLHRFKRRVRSSGQHEWDVCSLGCTREQQVGITAKIPCVPHR